MNSVSKEISASILFAESAADIWKGLRERFQQNNGPHVFQLRRELINLRQEQDLVSIYFTKLKALWKELNNFRPICNCGKCNCDSVTKIDNYFQTDHTMTFLVGLNESFTQVRSQILMMYPLPPVNRVFSLIVPEDRQRAIGLQSSNNVSTDSMAFAARTETLHKSVHNKGRVSFPRERPFYTKCNIHGHTVDTSYKIHGYQPGYKHIKENLHPHLSIHLLM